MYNSGKIIIGILIFLAIFTSPLWYSLATGSANYYPNPVIATKGLPGGLDRCVRSTEYMRESHMDLLHTWRNEVVRDGDRIFVADDGRRFMKSLTGTCLRCHSNKAEFCDKCHDYMAVGEPDCWNCHVVPQQEGI